MELDVPAERAKIAFDFDLIDLIIFDLSQGGEFPAGRISFVSFFWGIEHHPVAPLHLLEGGFFSMVCLTESSLNSTRHMIS